MSENVRELTVPLLIERQDKQFKEIRDEMKSLVSATHENALSIKELVGALSESSVESRHTRSDVLKLEDKFNDYVKTNDEEVDTLKTKIEEKRSAQKLLLTIGGAILSSIFAISGWLFGKS